MKLPLLKKRKEFVAVAKRGLSVAACGVVVQVWAHDGADTVRVGFTTTKKLGHAVVRNRIRRRLRAAAAAVFATLPVQKGDFVLIGRRATFDRPFDALKKDLTFALRELARQGGFPMGEETFGLPPTDTADKGA